MTTTADVGFKQRLGSCYRLAYQHAMDNRDAMLVHGTISRDGSTPLGHAWVEFADGTSWEPITELQLPTAAFARFFGTTERVRYDWQQAALAALESGHYGSWTEEDGTS